MKQAKNTNYLKFQRVEPTRFEKHPFAFTNSTGAPETIKNFQRLHKRAVEKIGLTVKKELGTTEHGHRHAYGFRARKAGLDQVAIQKAMHHKSPLSCLVYIKPTLEEVEQYCLERKNNVNAKKFYDYYEANNWKDQSGKPVKSWKQKMIANWEKDKTKKSGMDKLNEVLNNRGD